MNESLKNKLCQIKVLALDVDGVLTDAGLYLGTDGMELKRYDAQDGMGVTLARMAGLKTAIITGRQSESVERRGKELKFDAVFQGAKNKMIAFREMLSRFSVSHEEVCYAGDDLLDLSLLKKVGVAATPANGRPEIRKIADIVTQAPGGRGAVRELVELIVKAQGKWEALVQQVEAETQ